MQHKNKGRNGEKNNNQVQNKVEIAAEAKERPKENQLPSMGEQVKNFAGSFFKHMLTGFGKVDEPTYNDRLDKCVNCEFFMANIGRCSKCGCPCATKASWKSSSCPVGKW